MFLDYTSPADLSRVPMADAGGGGGGKGSKRILKTHFDSYQIDFFLSSRVSPP